LTTVYDSLIETKLTHVVKNSPGSPPRPWPSEVVGTYPTTPVEKTAR
jgi:hypothetical protein